jgi:hypothetical protein
MYKLLVLGLALCAAPLAALGQEPKVPRNALARGGIPGFNRVGVDFAGGFDGNRFGGVADYDKYDAARRHVVEDAVVAGKAAERASEARAR